MIGPVTSKNGTNTKKLKEKSLECNIEKSLLGKTEMEYPGFWVTQTGIQPINKKVEDLVNITPPKNTKELHVFTGIVNYYGYMRARQSHLPHHLTALTSNQVKFK